MVLTLNNTNTLTADNVIVGGTDISQLFASKSELTSINTANTTDIATNTADIAVLNTKQLQNFQNISSITHLLNTDYQTNATLTSTFYNKTEIDTTFTNYYTSTQIDTNLSTNFQTNTQLATNYYNKTEVDGLVGAGGGYTDTEIDNLLALRVPLSDFTNRFSANPIIDCSAPTVIHSGLTLNNSTVNISPVAGLTFSNQTGGGDKVLAEFKNATSYITLQGDKIFCNNTSDDAIKQLDLTNNNAGYKMSGKIETPTGGLVVENTADANLSFTVRNTDNYITFNNDNIDCYNSVGDTGRILNLNNNANQYVKSHSLLVDTGANTLTGGYTLDVVDNAIVRQNLRVNGLMEFTDANTTLDRYVNATKVNTSLDIRTDEDALRLMTGTATDGDTNTHLECDKANSKTVFYKDTDFRGNLDLTNSTGDILLPTAGFDMFRNSGDANYNLRIRDTQGVFEFKNRNFRCMNPSNPANGTEMILHDTGGDYRLRIGSTTTATVGIGRAYNFSYHLTVGGVSNFNETRVENDATFLGQQLLSTDGRIFQRADVNNSLNVISTEEINFSLQTDRTTDPTTGTICLQLNDTNGITLNRAVTNNLTFNSIGNIVGEADVVSWGRFMFQNSSELKEVLDGQYKLFVRNGDTLGDINLTVGLESSTPEYKITDGKVKMNNLEITQETISTVDQIQFLNTDAGGEYAFYFGSVSVSNDVFSISPGGILVNGDIEYTGSLIPSSDKRLKKDIKELNQKMAVELVKYIVPKTYRFIDDRQQGKSCVGFIANDFMETKKMPDEWQNIVKEGKDGYLKFDYTSCVPILWSALQATINEVEELKDLVKTMKKEMTTMKGEITKLKKKIKDDD